MPGQASTAAESLTERLRAFEGRTSPVARRGRLPVNEAMIQHWCDALGDRNPVYVDPAAAAGSAHAGVIAPPAMLQTWCMEAESLGEGESIVKQVMDVLDAEGYSGVVATNYDHEYNRALRLGDLLTEATEVESVTGPKRTGLGEGYFVTFLHTYTDAGGQEVGRARMRVLKFRPPAAQAPPPPAVEEMPRPQPVVNRDNEFFWDGVAERELRIQRCTGCGELRHPPAPMCPGCGVVEWDTVVSSGRGTVHSFVVHHHPPMPGFAAPFVVVLVDLEEGTRIVSNLVGVEGDEVAIGQAVLLDFQQVDDELAVPVFRPAPTSPEEDRR